MRSCLGCCRACSWGATAHAREQQTPVPSDGSTWLDHDAHELDGGFLPFASPPQPRQQTCSIPGWCRGPASTCITGCLSGTSLRGNKPLSKKRRRSHKPVQLHAQALPGFSSRDPHLLSKGKNQKDTTRGLSFSPLTP